MYIPPFSRIDDPVKLQEFMEAHSFATLVTYDGREPFATHLPVRAVYRDGVTTKLVSHMARANPQWRHFSLDADVLTVFSGPHAYISPSWYSTGIAVPTWNYSAVHVYGSPRVLHDHDEIVSVLAETVDFYERSFARPWPGVLPTDYRDQMIKGIVAFEIQVTRIEGKFKLGQNRSRDDIHGVFSALTASGNSRSLSLADLMVSEKLIQPDNE